MLVLLGWGTSLETQPARAATGTVEDLRQFEKKLQEAVRRVAPAVVGVGLSARDGTEQYRTERGSGVVIDESGLVLTHGHQADPLDELFRNEWEVRFPDGAISPPILRRLRLACVSGVRRYARIGEHFHTRGLGGDDFRRNSNRSLHCRESHVIFLFGLRLRRAFTGD